MCKKAGYLYILSNKIRTVLYTGVTSNLTERVKQHRRGEGSAFTRRYKVRYLMYFEQYPRVIEAIEREKQIKKWKRAWKLKLIRQVNPELRDLWPEIIEGKDF